MGTASSCAKMQRYFGVMTAQGPSIVDEDELRHFLLVMRGKAGDRIEVVAAGKAFVCDVIAVKPSLRLSVKEELAGEAELGAGVILAFALLKGEHTSLVLEKGTELGVARFIPFVSSRSVVRIDEEKGAKKAERFSRIILGAASQSHRKRIPSCDEVSSFREVLSIPADLRLFAYEGSTGGTGTLSEALSDLPRAQSVLIVIGPEGGFSDEEAAEAKEKGFSFVSLGRRILRAETACLYACSIVSYLEEI